MNFDARKDYRQTLRFFNENFMAKSNEGEEAEGAPQDGGGQPNEDNK